MFRYDQTGQLVQTEVFSDDGRKRVVHDKLLFSYSKRGELLSETGHLGTLSHRYDELGNRCATTLPDGRTINRLHYGSGHLHQINIDGEVISDFERNDLHREILRTQGQLTTRFGYDKLGRKTWQDTTRHDTHEQVPRKEWEYDRAGELVSKVHSRNGQTRYSYDALGRIIGAIGPAGNEFFEWDAAANLVDTQQVGGYVKYNRVTVYQDKRYDYDVHGRMETKRIGRHTEQDFRYDGEHRLREVHTVRNGVRQVVYFDYDALGRRIRKRDAFGETLFLWDGLQMIQEQRGGNVATYLYEPGTYVPLARVDGEISKRFSLDTNKKLPGIDKNNGTFYFNNDPVGIPNEIHTNLGELAWAADFKVWGSGAGEMWHRTDLTVIDMPISQNLRYQGQYFDREIGLYYNTFRYYDPDIGRFINEDPVGLEGGLNFYQYAPNPSSWIDPLGWARNPANDNRAQRPNAWRDHHTIPQELGRNPDFTKQLKAPALKNRKIS